MDGEKQKVSIEQHMPYADAVAYLEALLKGFKEGRIVVERGGESVVLTPPQSVNVEKRPAARATSRSSRWNWNGARPPPWWKTR